MKLRTHENSVRFRLTQSEVYKLGNDGIVEEYVEFGETSRFGYRLRATGDHPKIRASFANGIITVDVPASVAVQWPASEDVGLEGEQLLDCGKKLMILIEKDFACLKP